MKRLVVRNIVLVLTVLVMIALTILSTRTADGDTDVRAGATPSVQYTINTASP